MTGYNQTQLFLDQGVPGRPHTYLDRGRTRLRLGNFSLTKQQFPMTINCLAFIAPFHLASFIVDVYFQVLYSTAAVHVMLYHSNIRVSPRRYLRMHTEGERGQECILRKGATARWL